VNAPQVIHETIDNEVVIINLASGSYYSLVDTAQEIWGLLDGGVDPNDLPAVLLKRYEGDASEVTSVISEFVTELCSDALLVPDHGSLPDDRKAPIPENGPRTRFQAPRLERFTEMQHLIALDPIHEVDEGQGWPHT
jgi:hypothetical protein